MARAGVVVVLALTLANCSSGERIKNSNYSRRVVAEGEPVPKGGGSYKIGKPYNLNGRTYHPTHNPHYRAEGIASWYGRDFHGRLTANGEVYDMNALSAAHPTMPMPSYARVTNLENGRSIVVRVNDRGPYAHNRVIDLSIGAAKALDAYRKGLARVRVEYVGRAALTGSDDRVLMATLRHGRPAPSPSYNSRSRLASAAPAAASLGDDGASDGMPLPAERPYSLGASSSRRTAQTEVTAVSRVPVRSVAQRRTPVESAYLPPQTPAPDAGALGLMSGRGLY
ncbi:MAG: septal ring lytic transglycosylase RlpA family protein [Xanthobacteraceae bacterium]